MSSVLITSDEYDYFCAMQWQPMETAPKDGTIVLGYDRKAKKWNVKFMTYHTTMTGGYWRNEVVTGVFNPTHWMPLPKPPEEKE